MIIMEVKNTLEQKYRSLQEVWLTSMSVASFYCLLLILMVLKIFFINFPCWHNGISLSTWQLILLLCLCLLLRHSYCMLVLVITLMVTLEFLRFSFIIVIIASLHCQTGVIEGEQRRRWWLCCPLWWLVSICFISTLFGWDCNFSLLLMLHTRSHQPLSCSNL